MLLVCRCYLCDHLVIAALWYERSRYNVIRRSGVIWCQSLNALEIIYYILQQQLSYTFRNTGTFVWKPEDHKEKRECHWHKFFRNTGICGFYFLSITKFDLATARSWEFRVWPRNSHLQPITSLSESFLEMERAHSSTLTHLFLCFDQSAVALTMLRTSSPHIYWSIISGKINWSIQLFQYPRLHVYRVIIV